MNRIVRFTSIALVSLLSIISILFQTMATGTIPKSILETPPPINITQNINFGRHFQDLGVEGSITIYNLQKDRIFQHNPQRNRTPFPVASTFKILNSLIALETKVISDEIAVLTWDGITREFPGWNRDLNMREAFKLSAVWFYQVLARRVGYERMVKWITQAGYGNQEIGDKDDIDRFWLNGKLQITPEEQIQFLRRLYQNNLPFSERSLSIVKDIMIVEKTPNYTIRAKTGWFGFGDDRKQQIGWYVGYIEKGENIYFFATNIDMRNEKDPANRIELTRRCFKDLGVL
jgi:beta-lactamase class D